MRSIHNRFCAISLLIAFVTLGSIAYGKPGQSIAGSQQIAQNSNQSLAATWNALFEYGGSKLRLVLRLAASPSGEYSGVLDSPDQGATDIKIDSVSFKGGHLVFIMSAIGVNYEGEVNTDLGEIVGNWKQGPLTVPVIFRREGTAPAASLKRGNVLLGPCGYPKLSGAAHCGTYDVFEDRNGRTGRKIALKVLVFSARSDKPKPDPIFFIAGGPGQSAVGVVRDAGDFLSDLRQDRDLVFVDQRGTGDSNQLNCAFYGDLKNMSQFFGEPRSSEKIRKCRTELEQHANLSLYTTPIAMDDLDEIRVALGYDQINLYGGSYGTNAALSYLRQHPEHVRAVVLKGVAPLEYKLPLPFAKGVQHAMERVLGDCAADETCNKNFPNLKSEFDEVLARLEKSPVSFPVLNAITGQTDQVTMTRGAFIESIRVQLYSPEIMSILPLMIHQAFEGDYTSFAEYTFLLLRQIGGGLATGMQLSVLCSEHVPFITEDEIKSETAGTWYGDHRVREMQSTCKDWPVTKAPATFKNPVRSNKPVLLISGDADPVTPPSVSAQVAKSLTNSTQVIIMNGTHLTESPCINGIVSQFIATASTASLNTKCVDDIKRPAFVYKLPQSFKPKD